MFNFSLEVDTQKPKSYMTVAYGISPPPYSVYHILHIIYIYILYKKGSDAMAVIWLRTATKS